LMNFVEPDSFRFTIPGDLITTCGLEYRITAFDSAGNSSNSPFTRYHSARVNVAGEGETKVNSLGQPVAQPSGTEMEAYRMISIPLQLNSDHPNSVLIDDLGSYDEERWRFADYKYPEKPYPDYYVFLNDEDNISPFTPGKAFFLIVKNDYKIIDSGPGISVRTDTAYTIPLQMGWNLIGNPFNFPIPLKQLSLQSGGDIILWSYEGKWSILNEKGDTKILPWEGYAIYNYVPSEKLLVYPNKNLVANYETTRSSQKCIDEYDWTIQISAKCRNAKDETNYVGVSSSARMEYDEHDTPEPPGVGEFVMVYMAHRDWGNRSNSYAIDIQSLSEAGNFWDFEVVTNISKSRVTLEFKCAEQIPDNFMVHLIDRDLNIAQTISESQMYSFLSGNQTSQRRFRLIAGTESFIKDNNLGISSIPTGYYLSENYPNPFNPFTSLYYKLPSKEKVKIQIINVLGQVVKTLVNDEIQTAGTYIIIWDGKDDLNKSVASGVYFCFMKYGEFGVVRKLLLLK